MGSGTIFTQMWILGTHFRILVACRPWKLLYRIIFQRYLFGHCRYVDHLTIEAHSRF